MLKTSTQNSHICTVFRSKVPEDSHRCWAAYLALLFACFTPGLDWLMDFGQSSCKILKIVSRLIYSTTYKMADRLLNTPLVGMRAYYHLGRPLRCWEIQPARHIYSAVNLSFVRKRILLLPRLTELNTAHLGEVFSVFFFTLDLSAMLSYMA